MVAAENGHEGFFVKGERIKESLWGAKAYAGSHAITMVLFNHAYQRRLFQSKLRKLVHDWLNPNYHKGQTNGTGRARLCNGPHPTDPG
jgi:hypothetical protein